MKNLSAKKSKMTETPITTFMLSDMSRLLNVSILESASLLISLKITTLEEAWASPELDKRVKKMLLNFLQDGHMAITVDMLFYISNKMQMSFENIAKVTHGESVRSVEQAIAHPGISEDIKQIFRNFLSGEVEPLKEDEDEEF